jgi:hypothetical protein
MVDFKNLISIENYITKSDSVLEDDISDEIIEYFETGYRDSINASLINGSCSRVEMITTLQEYVYVIGYKTGVFDYVIGHCNDCNIQFSESYKKAIKSNLMTFNIKTTISDFNSWLMSL